MKAEVLKVEVLKMKALKKEVLEVRPELTSHPRFVWITSWEASQRA